MTSHPFSQVDVFSVEPFRGNPVAVVHEADALGEGDMAAFARWTNLSETTFLLRPSTPEADYRLRIFTPGGELPFAGHPTLGSCRAWLDAGGAPRGEFVVQECAAGLVRVRREGAGLAFAAPPLRRSGEIDSATLAQVLPALGLDSGDVLASAWVVNGPEWMGLWLRDAETVLSLRPDRAALGGFKVGVAGAHPADGPADIEVRAFAPGAGVPEDPVTGSLNAGLALWLIGAGLLPPSYTAAQGGAIGRAGRVHITSEGDTVWVGGATTSVVRGTVEVAA